MKVSRRTAVSPSAAYAARGARAHAEGALPVCPSRVVAWDALRVFAIATVVAIHCFMPLRGMLPAGSVPLVIDDVLHYAVPLFVFISGALVWGRPWSSTPGAYRRFVTGRLTQIGLPYTAWAIVYLGALLATASDPVAQITRAGGLLLTGHVWYHLYFVPMLLTFYLITPLASRAIRAKPELLLVVIYVLRIALWPSLSLWLRETAPALVWSYATHLATHLPHMALGAWFAVRQHRLPSALRRLWPLVLGAGLIAVTLLAVGATAEWPAALRRLVYPLGMAATILGLVLGGFALEPRTHRVAPQIARAAALSFGVYLVHPLWLLALESLVTAAGLDTAWLSWWAVPAACLLVGSASLASASLLADTPATDWLVGGRGRSTREPMARGPAIAAVRAGDRIAESPRGVLSHAGSPAAIECSKGTR